jgi:hypothetical protein
MGENLDARSFVTRDTSHLNRFDQWLDYYNLNINDFQDSLSKAEKLNPFCYYNYSDKSLSLYQDLFIFSNDSTKYIDLDSYSLVLKKKPSGELFITGGEVDSEVALVDKIKRKRIRIVFCGTECKAEEVFWINDNMFYILGFTKKSFKDFPTIWRYSISQDLLQEIKYKTYIDLTGKNYVQNIRLKMIKIY